MALKYRVDVLQALKTAGYSTYKLRREKILAEATMQRLRTDTMVDWATIDKLCKLLRCQPGDILQYTEEAED